MEKQTLSTCLKALLFLCLMAYSCKQDSIEIDVTDLDPNIYVVGNESVGASEARLWKNGKAATLNTLSETRSATQSLFVYQHDVYVCGQLGTGSVVWKNGLPIYSNNGSAQSIFVANGDVYVAGFLNNTGSIAPVVYWKNGVAVKITDGSSYALANAISVVDDKVYLVGYSVPSDNPDIIKATLWKDGMYVFLSNNRSEAKSICGSGKDVYVVGYEIINNTTWAFIWKNGIFTSLGNNTTAYTVFVSGNDVYVGGSADREPVIWKNGTLIKLPNEYPGNYVSSLFVKDGDYYALGNAYNSKYWKNGELIDFLEPASSTSRYLKAIFVAPKQY